MKAKILRKERYSTGLNLNLLITDEPEVLDSLNKLTEKSEIEVDIQCVIAKRSLNQNNLLWEYITRIAEKTCAKGDSLTKTKEAVYLELLKEYGQSIIVTVKEGVDLETAGFKYFERFKDGLIGNTRFVAYRMFIGSSHYNQEQQSFLIEGAKKRAAELGILL